MREYLQTLFHLLFYFQLICMIIKTCKLNYMDYRQVFLNIFSYLAQDQVSSASIFHDEQKCFCTLKQRTGWIGDYFIWSSDVSTGICRWTTDQFNRAAKTESNFADKQISVEWHVTLFWYSKSVFCLSSSMNLCPSMN